MDINPVEFLGITFRSANHLWRFLLTAFVLVMATAVGIAMIIEKSFYAAAVFWSLLGCIFILVSVDAIQKTNWGAVNGSVYSVDCIWYNALLAGICFSGVVLCLRLRWLQNTAREEC